MRLNDYTEDGHSYARYSNPTNEVLEKRIASLDGGSAAVGFGSGMAAIANTFFNLTTAGDEIVATNTLYGGSLKLLRSILPDYGVSGRFVDNPDDIESFRSAITEKTKAIYIESLGNPLMNIVDIRAVADLAHEHGIPLIVDNTFATPYLLRPFDYGADIVIYSATKYLAGHGTTIAGLVVEKGDFPWRNGKFPQFESFYQDYDGRMDPEMLRTELFTRRLRMRYLTDMGAHLSPMDAFNVLQGMETLSLRMERHVANAEKVAAFLANHPKVENVAYPGLPDNPYHALAEQYFPAGAGAMMSIQIAGGQEAALRVLEKVRVFDYMVNVGDAKSMIVHPASSTHYGVSPENQAKAGVYENTLRLSVGIEDADDLLRDLAQSLED
jgi:O-acetylhomoserine (thiol)-lyase